MQNSVFKSVFLSFCLFLFSACSFAGLPHKKVLTAELAQEMINAAIVKAKEMNLKVSVAILDTAGQLKAFVRMDGARSGSIEVAQLKAGTSARFEVASRQLAENNLKNENRPYRKFPKVILLPGGLPVVTSAGEHVGAIGVSGASADQDEQCAQAGIDKIQNALKTN